MDNLKEIIQKMIERIKKHKSLYERSEENVRIQIINPILKGLGWDPENPEEVQANITSEEGVPDYSLLKDNKKVLFIEAKKLSIDITQKDIIRKLASYCFGEGLKYGVLTNGSIWLLFRSFQEGTTITDRIVWKTNIENDDLTAIVRTLNTISRETVENIENLIEELQSLDKIWQSLLDDPKEMIKGLIPVFERLVKERNPNYEVETSTIEDFIKEGVKELISRPIKIDNGKGKLLNSPVNDGNKRKAKRVRFQKLVDAGLIKNEQTLFLFYNQRISDEQAQIIVASNKLKYKRDGKLYTPSDLALRLLKKHKCIGSGSISIRGPLHWQTGDGKLLHDLNEQVR